VRGTLIERNALEQCGRGDGDAGCDRERGDGDAIWTSADVVMGTLVAAGFAAARGWLRMGGGLMMRGG